MQTVRRRSGSLLDLENVIQEVDDENQEDDDDDPLAFLAAAIKSKEEQGGRAATPDRDNDEEGDAGEDVETLIKGEGGPPGEDLQEKDESGSTSTTTQLQGVLLAEQQQFQPSQVRTGPAPGGRGKKFFASARSGSSILDEPFEIEVVERAEPVG
ncbi:unnamed protein product, partial [Amoebophrya sp. A25]|eukprot:GSA25T00006477001.1